MPALAPVEIKTLAGMLDELDYYQVLEIDPAVPASGVKRGYYSVSRRFHPDANRHLQGEDRTALERIAKRVTEAYSVLRDARRRRAYDEQLQSSDEGKRMQLAQAEARAGQKAREEYEGKTPNGRRYSTLARSDIARGDLQSAVRNLQTALTFEPSNEGFKAKLAEVREQLKKS